METIIWPIYLDSRYSRGQGRKLSLEYCVEEPKIREINYAAKKLKLKHRVESAASYPGSWWEHSGRIIIDYEYETKLELLKNIANTLKSSRK